MIICCQIVDTSNEFLIQPSNDIEIINILPDPSLSFIDRISLAGIEIEKILIDQGRIWTNNPKYHAALIIWKQDSAENVALLFDYIKDLRGEEIVVNTLNTGKEQSWIVGHPRAIVKWAASIFKIWNFKARTLDDPNQHWTARFLWWAHRLNLKLTGLHR